MKAIFVTLLSCLFYVGVANAQCAIYVCNQTGAWGGYYNDGNPPYLSLEKIKQEAYKSCVNQGGTNCSYFWATDCSDCWVGFMLADNGNKLYYAVDYSYEGKSQVESSVKNTFEKSNGISSNGVKVYSWYIPK